MFNFNKKKMFYAYSGGSKCITQSEDTLKEFVNKTGTNNVFEFYVNNNLKVDKGTKVNFVVIKDGKDIVDLKIFSLEDDSIHESVGEKVNSLYMNGNYKIFKLKLK